MIGGKKQKSNGNDANDAKDHLGTLNCAIFALTVSDDIHLKLYNGCIRFPAYSRETHSPDKRRTQERSYKWVSGIRASYSIHLLYMDGYMIF